MKLGHLSISLSVKDLQISKAFYEKLGFVESGGNKEEQWLIMQNPDGHTIGLFQGMLDNNLMTFNPGWDKNARELTNYDDVRDIQKHLKEQGIELTSEVDENTTGPGNIMFEDPDGNHILVDQHR